MKRTIKLLSLITALVMSLGTVALFSGCADEEITTPPEENPPVETPPEENEDDPYSLFDYDCPDGYDEARTDGKTGEIKTETYTTYTYSADGTRGEEVQATAYVYLPYGYDADKQYDVLYLLHGGGENEGYWFNVGDYAPGGDKYRPTPKKYTIELLDNMMGNGDCQPTIVVTPTINTNGTDKFYYEFKNDLIPAIESKYSTYADKDITPESLTDSRDHRAYAGFSMGSMTSFQSIWMHSLDYVSYIGSFSGCDPSNTGLVDSVIESYEENFSEYDVNYWFCGTGTRDTAHDEFVENYNKFLQNAPAGLLQEGEDYMSGDNCIFVDKPGKGHSYQGWIVDLYNVMKVFFKVGTFVNDVPEAYKTNPANIGTVEELEYTTYRYSDDGAKGEALATRAYVYLPYGYDNSKQYNVLYLMHGIGDNEGFWFGVGDYKEGGFKYQAMPVKYTLEVLNNIIANNVNEPTIVVTPTIMRDDVNTAEGLNSMESFKNTTENYHFEFKNDLIPAVESKYSTYAGGDISPESLIASRDHRAYAGLSMGSITCFASIFTHCLDYVSYIGNFSGCDPQGENYAQASADALNSDEFKDYKINYWYNGNGDRDTLHDDHVAGYELILEQCAERFVEGDDYMLGENCIFVDKPGKGHSYQNWIVDLYNVMQVFFKAN